MTKYTGGCACGAIRYEILAEPLMAGHCQCQGCQKHSGTGHSSAVMFPKSAVKYSGTAKHYETKADSGNLVARAFCPNCGSGVYSYSSGMPDTFLVTAGSLDDPSLYRPQMVVYPESGHAWDYMDPALPKFPQMPPMGS